MEKTKVCPKCMKEQSINAKKCEKCGFEFHVKEEVDTVVVSSNTTIIDDPVPLFVWRLISFLLPPVGFVLYIIWQKKWSNRSKACGVMALSMSIAWAFVGIVCLLLAIGIKKGDVLI